ncbi:UDP-3-O-(3-hydroxymyristoyl)glucosamine N-acyltransferase [Methylobacterium tardum]|jgi:acetyltransferase-like isoleucine patch superfamily enzyme|uniref:Acetyltransferase n=1 Tax=Methylobacterium tardum TaxID=374432 RepID=A0AA37TNA5_9HYPH|nr:hypothetical protein [Methylobacterium tardum]GJE52251.1 UDP-3-O-(3-hydroxymyristoyl)glucosamine N-acyltransferase [Methylobacterium tardum]GLS74288.1 hypothetical protein GCM10007890_63030 [Methylobacterium tardum]
MTRQLVMCGGGSLAVEVAALLHDLGACGRGDGYFITDVVAPGPVRTADLISICSSPFATHTDISSVSDRDQKAFIVCTGDPTIRHKVYRELVSMDLTLARIVHPMAYIAPSAVIGAGAIIYPGVFVGPFVQLGANVVLHAQVAVHHDARLDASVVLSPGALLCGHTVCGTAAFLGTGASILPKMRLGAYSKLSAGSVLRRPAGDGCLLHGNPATVRRTWPVAFEDET